MDGDLEQRLHYFEDLDAIRRLKTRYFEACDGGYGGVASHRPTEIARTFAENGRWDGGPFGVLDGRQAITDFYEKTPQMLAFTVLSEPIIEIDGDQATGRWNLLVYSEHAGTARLTGGTHHDEYVRTAEGWRIRYTRYQGAIHSTSPVRWSPRDN
jgi:hypothetical protein